MRKQKMSYICKKKIKNADTVTHISEFDKIDKLKFRFSSR
jgi:hypothetical protein